MNNSETFCSPISLRDEIDNLIIEKHYLIQLNKNSVADYEITEKLHLDLNSRIHISVRASDMRRFLKPSRGNQMKLLSEHQVGDLFNFFVFLLCFCGSIYQVRRFIHYLLYILFTIHQMKYKMIIFKENPNLN